MPSHTGNGRNRVPRMTEANMDLSGSSAGKIMANVASATRGSKGICVQASTSLDVRRAQAADVKMAIQASCSKRPLSIAPKEIHTRKRSVKFPLHWLKRPEWIEG